MRAGGDLTAAGRRLPRLGPRRPRRTRRYAAPLHRRGHRQRGEPGGWPAAARPTRRLRRLVRRRRRRARSRAARAPDDEPCWTFFPNAPKTVGTWVRRQCQELAVHRYDAEMAATGTAEAIDAGDRARRHRRVLRPVPRHASTARRPIRIGDADRAPARDRRRRRRVVRALRRRTRRSSPANTPRATSRCNGPANDLLLALWGRVDPDEIGPRALRRPRRLGPLPAGRRYLSLGAWPGSGSSSSGPSFFTLLTSLATG